MSFLFTCPMLFMNAFGCASPTNNAFLVVLRTAMVFIPARFADFTPLIESSITMHSSGFAPSRSAALRKMSGAGLPYLTSLIVLVALK